jgi:signal transduction histidine kinase
LVVARGLYGYAEATSFLLVGTLGQTTLIWMTWSLISSLSEVSQSVAQQVKVHEALAGCSQALLARKGEDPIVEAIGALLVASSGDYVYVDINKTDADGGVFWEIVAHSYEDHIAADTFQFHSGDYGGFVGLTERMNAGEVTTLRVADLPAEVRQRYEAESVVSEAMAPIMVGERWVGTIGFTDSVKTTWTDDDLYLLQRAAEMVAAYWERERAREGLAELAKAKDRFIATVSHELRTPLSAVVGFADTLAESLEEFSEAEIGEMVGLIAAQGHEVADLVDDLLTAERAASGNLTVNPTVIDIRAECELVVAGYKTEFFVNIEGDAEAWADKLRTRQIIRNLLTNASRYGGEAVRIEISERQGLVSIAVFDSGSGIRTLDAEHIFDPYFRSQKGESRTDSVGLGLAVARQLARIMGGDLEYQRREGWTCFELTLPVHQESSSRRQVAASA